MSGTDVATTAVAVVADVMSAFFIPGGSTLLQVANLKAAQYLQERRKAAAEVLINEIEGGYHGPIRFEEHDIDPLIEMVLRFSKAVADGAAKENLKLIAQVIAGSKKHKAMGGDKFRKWCGILENLTRDELVVIGQSYNISKQVKAGLHNDFRGRLDSALEAGGYAPQEIWPLLASVSRTGILLASSAASGMAYSPSIWLEEIGDLADIEAFTSKASS